MSERILVMDDDDQIAAIVWNGLTLHGLPRGAGHRWPCGSGGGGGLSRSIWSCSRGLGSGGGVVHPQVSYPQKPPGLPPVTARRVIVRDKASESYLALMPCPPCLTNRTELTLGKRARWYQRVVRPVSDVAPPDTKGAPA